MLIGRLGHLDRVTVPTGAGEVATRLDLVTTNQRLDFGIGRALDDLAQLGVFPTEVGLDLLVLATHVHAADTRVSRQTESQDSWTREIRLVVPVSDTERWTDAVASLTRMLNFLTGDRWLIEFRPRPNAFATAVGPRPRRSAAIPFDSLGLFSGGLDSLIGAIDVLEAGATPLLISHAGEGATSKAQNTCFEVLRKHHSQRPFDRLRLWMNFPKNLVRGVPSEDTTRGRSFLFFAVGVFAGTGFGGDFTLRVPENGLISLNVPLDPLRLSSLSTRTTHPFYVARWKELLAALQIPARIETPYWDKTKGEMVRNCTNPTLLRQLIPSSMSCSSPTKGRFHGRTTEHCGYCLPCLIRRAAIETGVGHGTDPTSYKERNLEARVLDTRQSEGQQVRSFQFAIERLRARPELARLLIHKPGPLSDESPSRIAALADVYHRGMEEVAAFVAGICARPR